jgi:hypothetical protein
MDGVADRQQDNLAKLQALCAAIKEGIDELARGNFVEVDDVDLEAYLDALTDRQ